MEFDKAQLHPATECLTDYAKRKKTTPAEAKQSRAQMVRAIGISDDAVYRLLKAAREGQAGLSVGDTKLRLIFFLESVGYRTEELARLSNEAVVLGYAWYKGQISIDDLRKVANTGKIAVRRFLKGESPEKSPTRKKLCRYAVEDVAPQLTVAGQATRVEDAIKALLAKRLAPAMAALPAAPPQGKTDGIKLDPRQYPQPPKVPPTISLADQPQDMVIRILAAMAQSMLPLAQLVEGPDFSDDDRRQLRRLAGGTTIFDLSNLFNNLCSERARRGTKEGENHGS